MRKEAGKQGYEWRDISVRGVAWFTVVLIISAIIIHIAIGLLFEEFKQRHPSPQIPSRIVPDAKMIAPAPRVQVDPVLDLETLRREEEAQLQTYGWIDKGSGVIRLPVARAMELMLQRGLPVRQPGSQDASGRTVIDLQREKGRTEN